MRPRERRGRSSERPKREKSLADHLLKSPYRGAAPPQANELLSPSKGYWIDTGWDGDLGDMDDEEEEEG